MAELMLKIGEGSAYQDGDVLCAFNARRIKCVHAEHICHVRSAERNSGGNIQINALARVWHETTHQFRFERLNAAQAKRVDIATGAEEVFGPAPNARGEAIDVRAFIARRKAQPDHGLFGEDGAEIWYGGRIDVSLPRLNIVWNAIEGRTPLREADHRRWPAQPQEMRSHLFVAVDNLTDARALELESPDVEIVDQTPVVHAKRKHRIDWANDLQLDDLDKQRIRDRDQEFDLREVRQFRHSDIVQVKPRGG